jgi:hypothetical protein
MQIGFQSLTGNTYEKELQMLEDAFHDLSSLKRKSHAMASMVMQGPLRNWQQQIPQLDDEATQSTKASVSLKFCALKVTAIIRAHVGGGMAISPGAVTLLRLEQLNLDLCVDEGTLKRLEIKLKSLELLQHPDEVKLLHCGTQEGMESTSQPAIKIFLSTEGLERDVHIVSLPCIKMWLRFAAWIEVVATFTAFASKLVRQGPTEGELASEFPFNDSAHQHCSSPSSTSLPLAHQQQYLLVINEDTFPGRQFSILQDLKSLQDLEAAIGMSNTAAGLSSLPSQQLEKARIVVKACDFVLDFLIVEHGEKRPAPPPVTHDGVIASLAENRTSPGKLLTLSVFLCVNELQIREDGSWVLTAGMTKGQGKIMEVFCDIEMFEELCLQSVEIQLMMEGSIQQSPLSGKISIQIQVDNISLLCSNSILRFFKKFTLEPLQSSHSAAPNYVEGKLEIQLNNASFLLSDGRVSSANFICLQNGLLLIMYNCGFYSIALSWATNIIVLASCSSCKWEDRNLG